MKVRNGFVSNSSSSSFIINKSILNPTQIEQIKNHIQVALDNDWVGDGKEGTELDEDGDTRFIAGCDFVEKSNEWHIIETDTHIKGSTIMTNFNMEVFMEHIGVKNVSFYDGYGRF